MKKRDLSGECDSAHVREVAGPIGALGFCAPILIGKNNIVLDGEIRLEAAKLLALAAVPCIRVDHLTDAEHRALRLAVNRLGEKGEWDLCELKIEFEELVLADAPIEISGFFLEEIDQIFSKMRRKGSRTAPSLPSAARSPLRVRATCSGLTSIISFAETPLTRVFSPD